jgi:hypothetical protein
MFSARYWLFMVPFTGGILVANVKVSTFGMGWGLVVVLSGALLARVIFDALLYKFWTRK